MTIDKSILKKMFLSVAALFLTESGRLSEIDSRFGDGDHGVTIKKIGQLIEKQVNSWGEESIHDFIDGLGDAIMGISGGSAGPLYGTLVSGLAVPLTDETTLDAAALRRMLSSCRDEMFEISTARVGDKTMMDALIPAVDAAAACTGGIGDILKAAAQAAAQGAQDSEQYMAKYGRAKSYKEQTIGTPDAGAVSTAAFFEGLSRGYEEA